MLCRWGSERLRVLSWCLGVVVAVALVPVITIAQDANENAPGSAGSAATPGAPVGQGSGDPLGDPEPETSEATSVALHVMNTDTVSIAGPTGLVTLTTGERREFALTYAITTPRLETAVTAELRAADSGAATGWQVHMRAGQGEWSGDGPRADLVETASVDPGTSLEIALRVTAPIEVTAEYTVDLHISSNVTNELGELEAGIDAYQPPIATLRVVPALPAEQPLVTEINDSNRRGIEGSAEVESNAAPDQGTPTSPSPLPTTVATPAPEETEGLVDTIALVAAGIDRTVTVEPGGSLSCDVTGSATAAPGGYVDLTCMHKPAEGETDIRVTASFSEVEGDGWKIAIGEVGAGETRFGPPGDTPTWEPEQVPHADQGTELIVRVFVPADSDSSQWATIDVYTGQEPEPVATWTINVSDNPISALATSPCNPTIAFTSSPVAWDSGFLVNEQRFDREIAYEVTAQEGCAWSVTLAATAFTYSGSYGGEPILPSALTFESIGLSAGDGVREVENRKSLVRPRVVLAADAGAPAGVSEHRLLIVLTLPAEAAPGSYRSTITVTVAEDLDPGG